MFENRDVTCIFTNTFVFLLLWTSMFSNENFCHPIRPKNINLSNPIRPNTIKNIYFWRFLCKGEEKKFFCNKSIFTSELNWFCHLRKWGRKFRKNNGNNGPNVNFFLHFFVSLCFLFIKWWFFSKRWQVIYWWTSFSLNEVMMEKKEKKEKNNLIIWWISRTNDMSMIDELIFVWTSIDYGKKQWWIDIFFLYWNINRFWKKTSVIVRFLCEHQQILEKKLRIGKKKLGLIFKKLCFGSMFD